jgi:hypothetical protein
MFLLLAKEIKHRVIDPMGDEPEEPQVRGTSSTMSPPTPSVRVHSLTLVSSFSAALGHFFKPQGGSDQQQGLATTGLGRLLW